MERCDLPSMAQNKWKIVLRRTEIFKRVRLGALCVNFHSWHNCNKMFHPSWERKSSSPFALDMQLQRNVARLHNHDFKEVCGNVSLIPVKKSFFLNFFINFRHLLAITFVPWIQWQKLIIHSFCQGKKFFFLKKKRTVVQSNATLNAQSHFK